MHVGTILLYGLFCTVVLVGVVAAILSGWPVNVVGTLGVWAVSAGAIAAVAYRFLARRR